MTENQAFLQHLRARLTQKPHQHIINHALALLPGIPVYVGYSFGIQFDAVAQSFLQFDDTIIEKIYLTADVTLFDENGRHFNENFKGCQFEFFLSREKDSLDSNQWLLLDLDDLLFYVNRRQNMIAVEQFSFPKLTNCELGNGFDFIMQGRLFQNKYFKKYSGLVLDLYYGNEINELFAIATNALAFLYRTRDRAIEELELTPNFYYFSQLHIYPRFNNAIAEVAGTLYAAWERIAFLFHEFFPLSPNAKMAPSFKKYIIEKVKEAGKDTRLQNTDLDWFGKRIKGDHLLLEDLRHPTVHFNDLRTPSGTRAVELMKRTMDAHTIAQTTKAWTEELEFLRSELRSFNDALPHAVGMLTNWASALGLG